MRRKTLLLATPARLAILLFLVAPVFIGCEDSMRPSEPSEALAASTTGDSQTLLLLPFDDDLASADGESPTQASGVTFETGISGAGVLIDSQDLLAYSSAGNFEGGAGTVEFWIKPRWNGDDHTTHFFFTIGDALWVVKDGADNLRFILGSEDSEAFQGYNLGAWAANDWHHVAVTWSVPGDLKTYVDGVQRISHSSGTKDLVLSVPPAMAIGSQNGSLQADAVIDELRISDVARSAEEIARSFAAGPTILHLAVQSITAQPFVSWRQAAKLMATTNVGTREYPPSLAKWSSSNPAIATVDDAGVIKAIAAGSATISAAIGGAQGDLDLTVKAPALPPQVEQINPFLATPAANSLYEIPVVILRFLPTADGSNLDVSVNPDFYELNPISLAALRRRIDTFDIRTKFMLEEGSRFRGYQDPTALPSIGYRVVAYITVYEPTPPGKVKGVVAGLPVYQPDYHQILERFDGRHYVEALGVKQFWLWTGEFNASSPVYDPQIHKPESFRALDESDMSSPLTGDISNSGRDPTDLPVYSSTYVVYDQNFRRSDREAVHGRGHQLEQVLEYANLRQDGNSALFWQKFVGYAQSDPNRDFRQGRCGWTHTPPNTSAEYDYRTNYNEVASDIADWTPEGFGRKTLVSAHTWGDHPYLWPLGTRPNLQEDRNEAHWYIYWMQSMPGRGNSIAYGPDRMTNWWRFTGDWEGSIRGGLGLHEQAAPACNTAISNGAAAAALETLADRVQALVAAGKLTRAEAHALGVKLNGTERLLQRGQTKAAANVLQAFVNQTHALVHSHRLSKADGQPLIGAAACLSTRLEGRS
jgi:concanavalin A-like lectin/glucanase superfamily protein/FIMAH domain-containing protein/Big-like domain-containing protein